MDLKILIVDDEAAPRDILVNYLPFGELGIQSVKAAGDGESALAEVPNFLPDIIISDIKMPRLNGIELAKRVRGLLPECKFIFLSGYPDKEYLKDAIKLKAASFVEKPIDLEEITETLREVIKECREQAPPDPRLLFFRETAETDRPLNDAVYKLSNEDLTSLSSNILAKTRQEAMLLLHRIMNGLTVCEGTEPAYIRQMFCQLVTPFLTAAKDRHITEFLEKGDYLLYEAPYTAYLSELKTLLYDTCSEFFRLLEAERYDAVESVNLYLKEHFADPELNVQKIAAALGFTHTYLCMLYKKNSGITINQQLTAIRIRHARTILPHTELKLYEVANQVGYSDSRYFAKVFLKETGLTPKEYRERHRHEA